MSNVRVLRMNELTSDRYEDVPLPVRQQLGDFNDKVDVDARSGNGLRNYDGVLQDEPGRDYQGLNPEKEGTRVLSVTYHLDTTPAPVNGAQDGPGSAAYSRANQATRLVPGDQTQEGVSLSTQGNATLAVQDGREHYVSTQREIPGRNERYAHAVGMEDETGASAPAGSGQYAVTIPSANAQDSSNGVPTGNISSVLSWVGDDKDRAQQAREAEAGKDNPRSSLIERLDNIIEDDKDN